MISSRIAFNSLSPHCPGEATSSRGPGLGGGDAAGAALDMLGKGGPS